MSFWKKLFGSKVSEPTNEEIAALASEELTAVKRLLKVSSGGVDFLRRCVEHGFILAGHQPLGTFLKGKACNFVFTCYASKGPDRIWSVQFKPLGGCGMNLVTDGEFTF